MSEVFISYARSTEREAKRIAEGLRALGYGVWRDDELPAHRDYAEVIEERLRGAKAVVVVWSAESVKSQWVRAEADLAREAGKLVQLSLDGAGLPMPFSRIQCADLTGWSGDPEAAGWKKVVGSVQALVGADGAAPAAAVPAEAPAPQAVLPDKPSIAVLPFADMTPAKDQGYFCDGMVVEIGAALSRFPSLFVIATGSSLSYRDPSLNRRRIAGELGVRYLLEGSVRKSVDRVRIAVELTDAQAGAQIWTERFDGALDDVFALQDTVANAVAGRIAPTIEAAELRRASARPTSDLGAYDLFLRAAQKAHVWERESFHAAIQLLDEALARDPDYGLALSVAGFCHGALFMYGWAEDREAERKAALEFGRRALRAEPDNAEVLSFGAITTAFLGGDLVAADVLNERALALNPGYATAWLNSGWIKHLSGRSEQGLEAFHTAIRIDPRSGWRGHIVHGIGSCLFALGRYEEAIPALTEAVELLPFSGARPTLVAALAHSGRIDEARAALSAEQEPDVSPDIYRDAGMRERLLAGAALAAAPA